MKSPSYDPEPFEPDEEWMEDDDDANEDTFACPSCGGEVHEDAQQCPHCKEWITAIEPNTQFKRFFWRVVAALAVLLILLATIL